jgi:colanic acid/amylovoran biosynthesis protein
MKIGILNAYDVRNMGDRAIVKTQIAWIHRHVPGAEVRIFSFHAENNIPVFTWLSVESLLHIPRRGSAFGRLVRPLLDWVEYRIAPGGRRKFREFDSCDAYLLCGGGYLYSSRAPLVSRNMAMLCLQSLVAVRTGKPVFQFPQSFGPFTRAIDRWFVTRLARALPVLVPRGRASLEFLKSAGFGDKSTMASDVVLALRLLRPEHFARRFVREGLGLAVIDFRFALAASAADVERYTEKIVEVAEAFHRRTGEGIRLFPQVSVADAGDDSVVAREVQRRLAARGIPVELLQPHRTLRRYIAEFQKVRVFVGSRMHSCIFALLAETPTVALSYQPKFGEVFDELGLSGWVAPIDRFEPSWAIGLIESHLARETELHLDLERRVEEAGSAVLATLDRLFGPDLARLK